MTKVKIDMPPRKRRSIASDWGPVAVETAGSVAMIVSFNERAPQRSAPGRAACLSV
jgi:hypothetical protein